jgi:hypothetical protein
MLTLSIQQPYAHLILAGVKRVENRTWPTAHRGRLAIHASRLACRSWSEVFDTGAVRLAFDEGISFTDGDELPPLSALPTGAIVGTVEVYDCLRDDELPDEWLHDSFVDLDCWCWLLRQPRALAAPFACKGQLRLWESPSGLTLP